ncbi:hypothetical protein PCL_04653 [Purpureocillium lilacinum]|uniref:Uncharacterized protein n=2 Tax=Purpureocillium lilacinum TaxID=33203 RepID=A0A2U3DX27_PURLI|nr:hypothetical protein PCL_04653 [Purpureocillium lilacinum]
MRASSYIVLMAIGAGSFGTAADTPATSPTATPSPRRKTPRSFFLAGKESRGLIVCPERDKMGVEIPCPPNVFCLPPYATCEGAKYVLRDWIPPRERAQCNACKCSGPRIPWPETMEPIPEGQEWSPDQVGASQAAADC